MTSLLAPNFVSWSIFLPITALLAREIVYLEMTEEFVISMRTFIFLLAFIVCAAPAFVSAQDNSTNTTTTNNTTKAASASLVQALFGLIVAGYTLL